MAIFDRFTSRSKAPKGYSAVNVQFTKEELEAISIHQKRMADVANAEAPAGTTMYVHPKVLDAITAQALTQYAEDLVLQLQQYSTGEVTVVMDKAIKAQLKAYTAHNLRIYLYQAAGMFELIDDVENAAKFFHLFLNFKESSADLRVAKENAKLIFYGAGMYISIPHFGLLP